MTAQTHAADYPAIHSYGLWLFIASEAFLFGILLAVRFALVGLDRPEAVSQILGIVLTLVLLTTSVFAHRAEGAQNRLDDTSMRTNLGVAIMLGIVFLVLVGVEWSTGLAEFPASTPYGSVFFLITGTHALHLFSGLLVLAALWVQSRRGALREATSWRLRAGIRYWHFVDAVWLTVFVTLYVL